MNSPAEPEITAASTCIVPRCGYYGFGFTRVRPCCPVPCCSTGDTGVTERDQDRQHGRRSESSHGCDHIISLVPFSTLTWP